MHVCFALQVCFSLSIFEMCVCVCVCVCVALCFCFSFTFLYTEKTMLLTTFLHKNVNLTSAGNRLQPVSSGDNMQ